MDTKKNISLWALYDFANSIVSIVFFFYFAQWIVVDKGIPDIYLNLTFTISAVLLLFTVPITGLLLDRFFRRITGLRVTTILAVIFYAICALLAIYDKEIMSLVFFTLAAYFYLLTFTFYTPLLKDITSADKTGRTSGIGIAANYLGQFAGLLLVLPFSNGSWNLFGAEPRAETLLPAVIIFAILTLPMLIYFHEPKKIKPELKIGDEIKNLVSQTKSLLFYPGIALFMLSYFFFNDAVLTAANNFPIFMEQVWGVSDTVKTYILIGILLTSAVGGLTAGLVADKVGHKKTLLFLVGGWLFILPFIAFIENFTLFVIATTVMGLWFGANWAVSRSVMSYLAPPQGHNLAFAYFGLVERASSFVGPIVWGLIVSGFVSIGSDRYRFATLAVTAFIVFGFISLWKVRSDRSYL
mgnify:CR=1 FL=1